MHLMRHKIFLGFFAFVGMSVLVGCSSKNKEPLEGDREHIFLQEDVLKPEGGKPNQAVSVPTAQILNAWPMASATENHALDPIRLGGPLKTVWSQSIGTGSASDARLINGPVAAEGKVFTVDTSGVVRAFSIKDGEKLWSTDSTPESQATQPFSGGLAYENGFVFCATPAAEVVMIAAKDGKLLKRFPVTAPVRAAPTVKNKHIYVVTINNQLEVINYETGNPVWSHTGMLETAGLLGGASPAIADGVVLVPYTSGEVFALRADNGAVLWSESLANFARLDPVSSMYHIKARPVIKNGYAYLISHGNQMRCINLQTGQAVWERNIGGIRTPAVTGDYLFMVTARQELVCVNRFSGAIQWVTDLNRPEVQGAERANTLWAGPILIDQQLVVTGSNGQVLVLSVKDGSLTQKLSVSSSIALSPIVVQGRLFVLTDSAELVAFAPVQTPAHP